MNGTILDEIAAYAKVRVEEYKRITSPDIIKYMAQENESHGPDFEAALRKPGLRLICEVKKASPSKGVISKDFHYLEVARDYDRGGADCISCLTEPKWFQGGDGIFIQIRHQTAVPMIRKDFIVDPYQIYQSRAMGADCVLLICALLDTETLERYLALCQELNLAALVEAHDEAEIDSAIAAGARIIGVNNRNLKDFSVDFSNAARLRDKIPPECVYVAESGVHKPEDLKQLREIGADAALVGEMLMRSGNRRKLLAKMKAIARG